MRTYPGPGAGAALLVMASAQLSYNPHEATTISTAKTVDARRKGSHQEHDAGSRGMGEPSSRKEVAESRTKPSTAHLHEAQGKDEQE
ncbi:uncharacterized protein [Setaria viridis]|uniref:uncharacterized protein n=1 Tax=Setaria viridis TaxID=4556 RepID=UPI0014938594|nr:uncharacterized protein LOC117851856 isoform X9 [Setaria viridis]XP_034589661.1 uncharacterized protein LOC117851856 isoform X9 [Setaria viridis]